MPIKASSAHRVEMLLADLGSDRASTRDAAVAGLTVLGSRAVDRLIALIGSDAPTTARVHALAALEAIGDPHAIDTVLAAIDARDSQVALAAVAAARAFLGSPRGTVVVDRLTAMLLDGAREDALRVAALDTLRALGPATIAPILTTLARDPRPAVRAAAGSDTTATPAERIALAAERTLPERADDLVDALTRGGTAATVPELLRIIEAVRDREAAESPELRAGWMAARGRAHVELASRGSRVALYDLRETLDKTSSPLPVDFLAALSKAGDASCLEAIADAYARAARDPDERLLWWGAHLADAFHSIAVREHITRRHAVARRLSKRLGATADALWKTR